MRTSHWVPLNQVQGNVTPGFRKDVQSLLFLRFAPGTFAGDPGSAPEADNVSTPAPLLTSVEAPIVVASDHSVIRPEVPVMVDTTPVVVVDFITPVDRAPSACSFDSVPFEVWVIYVAFVGAPLAAGAAGA